jgi:hypothetical protein
MNVAGSARGRPERVAITIIDRSQCIVNGLQIAGEGGVKVSLLLLRRRSQ